MNEDSVERSQVARHYYTKGVEDTLKNFKDFLDRQPAPVILYRPPAPTPLEDRQPGPNDVTPSDKEAWYWDSISGCWFFLPGPPLNDHYTHWLPHWALPYPPTNHQPQ